MLTPFALKQVSLTISMVGQLGAAGLDVPFTREANPGLCENGCCALDAARYVLAHQVKQPLTWPADSVLQ